MPKNPHADFSPVLDGYSGIGAFRFWCQTALPLTYDDSLSYYELLCKVVNYLNHAIEDLSNVEENTGKLAEAYTKLQNYVNEYFDNLNIEAELKNILDTMAQDGTLDALLDPLVSNHLPGVVDDKIDDVVANQIDDAVAGQIGGTVAEQLPAVVATDIPAEVTNWLTANVNPVGSAVMVDSSLAISGAAADAKVTGDKISDLKTQLNTYTKETYNILDPNNLVFENFYVNSSGNITQNAHYRSIVFEKTVHSGEYFIFNTYGKLPTTGGWQVYATAYYPQVGDTVSLIANGVSVKNKTARAPLPNANYITVNFGYSSATESDLDTWTELIKEYALVAITNTQIEFDELPYIPHRIIDVEEDNLSSDLRNKLNNNAQTVRYLETKTVHVGENLLGTATLGTGWSENDGTFTHTSGNTDDLTFSTGLEVGDIAILDFDTSYSEDEFINIGIGTAYRILCYNGTTHIRIPLKAIGNTTLHFTPYSNFSGTITNISLRKIEDTGTEIELEYYNTLTDNHKNTYGFWNNFLGFNTANNAVGTTRSIAIGYSTLKALQGGHRNIGIGTFALSQLIGGERNISIGADSMLAVRSGNNNIVVGDAALYNGEGVHDNVAIGSKALNAQSGTVGNPAQNVAIGTTAGTYTTGSNNTMIGYRAGYRNRTGNNNTIIGSSLGTNGGNNNTFIGASIQSDSALADSIGLGKGATPTKSNQLMLGSADITEVVVCGNKKIVFNQDGTVTWETLT